MKEGGFFNEKKVISSVYVSYLFNASYGVVYKYFKSK